VSWLLFLRPHRPEMPFDPTEEEERIVGDEDEDDVRALVAADPAVVSGIMIPELRPLRLSVR
jgi:uncharacterized protein YciI